MEALLPLLWVVSTQMPDNEFGGCEVAVGHQISVGADLAASWHWSR